MNKGVQNIINFLQNKKILLLGYGREGKSTHNFIIKYNVSRETFIFDSRDIKEELLDNNATIVDYNEVKNNYKTYDIIMKSPGFSLKNNDLQELYGKVTSQVELFIKEYGNQIVGITGTKGKSTTSSLIYELFSYNNMKTIFCGNIGKPCFNLLDDINNDTNIVCEFSSHQLEDCKYSPHVSIVTNIYPEHLDHYNSYEDYINAKKNIYKHQKCKDISIINDDIDTLHNDNYNGNVIKISYKNDEMFHVKHFKIIKNNNVIFDENDKRNIIGEHNLFNIAILFAVADIYNVDYKKVKECVEKFKGLPHRLEYVGKYNGIDFYNDSISTIPETCIFGLENITNVQTVILGGLNRGISYKKIIEYLNSNNNIKVICMFDTGKIIYDNINNEKYYFVNMQEAVDKAYDITEEGRACLFSPAAASYGFYKNFEERGNIFKECVNVSRETFKK